VRLSPLGIAATIGLLYQTQIMYDGDCGAISGMKIGRGNRSTRRKPAPVTLFPPQIPHDLTWARTRAAGLESRRLTAWGPELWHGLSIGHTLFLSLYQNWERWYEEMLVVSFNTSLGTMLFGCWNCNTVQHTPVLDLNTDDMKVLRPFGRSGPLVLSEQRGSTDTKYG
jgi:hypothetical protein